MENQVEIWKSHPDIVGIEVSTFGRVRSLKGQCYKSNLGNTGYLQVQFGMNGKHVNKLAHRLVAETFIPNPDNLPQVNHRDCNRTNNNVENLEWCSRSYNRQYREKHGISQTEAAGHPLFAINLSTLEVSLFQSQHDASRALGADCGSINAVIKGRLNKTNGYLFVNADDSAVDVVKSKLHDVGGVGLKIKH